ncbi:uncharacterized protein LOC132902477 [Amyelois transitella]|uniref:uncharacterized protein LOC132902477 n=1 Tax=Amyelois transitella TaxID=680683 RepID=UPI00298FD63D|nr:uncharacterized protein LOC132902477 [Amyelois transitella]
MKKNKQNNGTSKKKTEQQKVEENSGDEKNVAKVDSLDDEDQGFGGWLRSADGMETMKLFVIANSIVMVTTLAYPQIQTIFEILYEMLYDITIY